jgi:hypothetical protein
VGFITSAKCRCHRQPPVRPLRKRDPAQTALWDLTPDPVWQKRFYDFNVWTEQKRIEKLRYIHRNPVNRGLVAHPEQWRWSSFRSNYCGEHGMVRVNFQEWPLEIKTRPVQNLMTGAACSTHECMGHPPLNPNRDSIVIKTQVERRF